MQIALCTNGDFLGNIITNELVKNFNDEKFYIFIDNKPIETTHVAHLNELKFYTEDIFANYISPMVEKFYEVKEEIPDKKKYLTYKQLSKYNNLPIYYIEDLNSDKNFHLINSIKPDLIILFRFKTILKKRIISIPKFGVVNIHSGVLPQFRGIYSLLRALNQGLTEFGCTLHFINDCRIDAGDIINTKKTNIDFGRSYSHHSMRMFNEITPDLIDFVKKLKNNKPVNHKKQNETLSNYYSVPSIKEMKNLKKNISSIFEKQDLIDIINKYY